METQRVLILNVSNFSFPGSLINAQYVLSAAHCACVEEIAMGACSLDKGGKVQLNYDPKSVDMRIHLGLTSRDQIKSNEGFVVVSIKVLSSLMAVNSEQKCNGQIMPDKTDSPADFFFVLENAHFFSYSTQFLGNINF